VRKLMIFIILVGAIAETSRAQPVPCCPLNIGDRVRLLVDNPYGAANLLAGACGTVLCCDPTWPDPDKLFVSWDNWTDGINDDFSQCSQPPPAYIGNSGWWLECAQVTVDAVTCPAPTPVCGNGICEIGETAASCTVDCAPDCAVLLVGDRVSLLADNPYGAINLPAGSCGTVLCFDFAWTGLDQLFVSWDYWTDGVNDDFNQCQPPAAAFVPNSGWWVECAQVVVDDMGCPPPAPVCGNGLCETGEDATNCPADCAPPGTTVCGNGICEPGEDATSCPADCAPVCGDGICGPGEDSTNCPADCAGSCCDLAPGDLVKLLVDEPYGATGLLAGTCGTVVCCDTGWVGYDQTFISWNGWTNGLTPDPADPYFATYPCFPVDPSFTANSGWFVACDQVVLGSDEDGDGVVDCDDICPNTPAGEVVDAQGCGCSQISCDDGDACTTDTCVDAVCFHTPSYDVATQCCDPATGNTTLISDNNACTTDTCDALTGLVTHVDATPAGQCCDPATGTLTAIDDNNVCTTDACDAATGKVTHTSTAPAGQCCNPATGALTPIDDGNGCTTDICNADGTVTHVSNVPAGECCNPATGALARIDDDDPCTDDACAANGAVTHARRPGCPPTFSLTILPNGGTESYPQGSCMNVSSPTPPAGQVFSNWSGDISSSDDPVWICLNKDMTITANFKTLPATGQTNPGICGFGGPAFVVSTMLGMAMIKLNFARRRRRNCPR